MVYLTAVFTSICAVLSHNPVFRALLDGEVGSTETVTSSLDTVLNYVTKVIVFSGDILNAMLSVPIYGFLFAVSFIGIGVYVISLFRHGAKG